ncbi:alpha-L-rhamnosidase [Roseisalinus antarcticus]|uniref:alpha-L-rhamnosidase n=1 Tax=Roseisalinus antarcticus TaxID=254357 RepID=A0A1Y5RW34_9RHOB|nr:alpha-L-rhamnosidase [Roseisalinus antarcticus]SLN26555.1 Bacterial alpha-L-rhamnosidase [Roseisalinus antarcticus]
MRPVDLRCEYLRAPRGLTTARPRLSWALEGDGSAQEQTAYRICAGTVRSEVAAGRGDLWDSGWVASDDQLWIRWGGAPLRSDMAVFWSVRVRDGAGTASGWAEPAEVRTGLLHPEDWSARWIARYFVLPAGREAPADDTYDNPWQARPADYLRRGWTLPADVVRASAHVSALGLYEFYLNGVRVGDEVMAPGWTDYHQRVLYQSFDVTGLLRRGPNVAGAILGEGWYSGRVGHNQRRAGNHYGGRPAFLCQLQIDLADGTSRRIVTDDRWRTAQGPIRYSDFLMGEHYDATLEREGWARPGHDDTGWQPVEVFDPDPAPPRLTASQSPPAREAHRLDATCLGQKGTEWIFDFGQNIAGYVEMRITGATRGARFTLRHAEVLDGSGALYTDNLRFAVATDHYTACGAPTETFKQRFTFHGFRYAGLTVPEGITPDDLQLVAVAIQSDLPDTGRIETGNALVDQLASNIEWSQRGNFLSVPTDCPQRDERYGWSADAQVFWRTAGFFMDTSGFYAKWLDDILDAQLEDGAFTDVAPSRPLNPYRLTGQPGAPGWGDGPVIMCWQHWLRYGDRDLLARASPALERWAAYIAVGNEDHLRVNRVHNNYGDWLNVGPPTDRTQVATTYWAHVADLMARIAGVLGHDEAARAHEDTAGRVRAAFNAAWVGGDGRIAGDTQTAYLLALEFDLLPEAHRPRARDHLIRTLDAAGGHLQTGFLGVRHLCRVLADTGDADRAHDLLLRETYPGWGFSIRQGATTIWERWDGWTPDRGFQSANMNSFNHYAYGSVGEWLYARLAGIDWDPEAPGFRRVLLRPLFDARIGRVDAQYDAPTGRIRSDWQMSGRRVRWRVALPPNVTGRVELAATARATHVDGFATDGPGAARRLALAPGRHDIDIEIATEAT